MVFASALRFLQGILAIFVTIILCFASTDVLEIILNFTALNYISVLCELEFKLAVWGRYGSKLEEEAKLIETMPLPECMRNRRKHIRCWSICFILAVAIFTLLGVLIYYQESEDVWVTKTFRAEFHDQSGLQTYTGCYGLSSGAIEGQEDNNRYIYKSFE